MRMFAGVMLPAAVREPLAAQLASVASSANLGGLRWSGEDKLHITLRFFGSVAVDQLPALSAACTSGSESGAPFELRIAGAGAFPAARRAKVVWLGISHGAAELVQLAAAIAQASAAPDLHQDEHEYTPHLTVARLTQPRNASALIESLASIEVSTHVSGFSLIRSHQGATAHYESLQEFPFKTR
jgi:2'-5' RNA ligase